jgi:HK97 gp10 family phage protein
MSGPAEVRFSSNLPQVQAALTRLLRERMTKACRHLANRTKVALTGKRTGRRYIIPGLKTITARELRLGRQLTTKERGRRKYTASAPGEAPAVLFGHLRNSIKYRVVSDGANVFGIVGSTLEKAPWLEFGTSKMAPRPFLQPTYQREKGTIKGILGEKWVGP